MRHDAGAPQDAGANVTGIPFGLDKEKEQSMVTVCQMLHCRQLPEEPSAYVSIRSSIRVCAILRCRAVSGYLNDNASRQMDIFLSLLFSEERMFFFRL